MLNFSTKWGGRPITHVTFDRTLNGKKKSEAVVAMKLYKSVQNVTRSRISWIFYQQIESKIVRHASTLKKNKQFENENVTLNLEMFQYSNCNNPLVIFRNKTSNEKYL